MRRTVFVLSLIIAFAGCADSRGAQDVLAPPPRTTQSTTNCTVSLIADGDTFDCTNGDRIRFIGIDAPEMGQQPFGAEARAELIRVLPIGTVVQLERDKTERDVYNRRLAYVYQDGVFMNEMIVKRGFALTASYPPDTAKLAILRAAEQLAKASNVGLWKVDGFACIPADYRRGRC